MSATTPPTYREMDLELSLLADEPDAVRVGCAGEICLPGFQPGDNPLARFLGPGVWSRTVLLDLEKATFLDTSGVGWLIDCHQRFQEAGGTLVLYSVPPRVRYVLQLLQLEHVLPTAADLAAARSLATRGKV